MDTIFSTESLARQKRYAAWRDAICDVYVHVDVHADDQSNYDGFIREVQFGSVALTDVLLSHQQITRRSSHLSKLDKDCYYVQLIQTGNINVLQDGVTADECGPRRAFLRFRTIRPAMPRQGPLVLSRITAKRVCRTVCKRPDSDLYNHEHRPRIRPHRDRVLRHAGIRGIRVRCGNSRSPR